MSDGDAYLTIHVRIPSVTTTREAIADAQDRLDALAGLLADDDEVGGVESRDPTTLEGTERPELVVYSVPAAADRLLGQIRHMATALELDVTLSAREHEGDAWRDKWKDFYEKRVLGDGSLLLRPSWLERDPDEPAREVVIDPGRAFGTGVHETTRLCLDRIVAAFEGGDRYTTVLDLGCGSGILSLAAARLFDAASVTAIDVDDEAVATTKENIELNELAERISARVGTAAELTGEFELVVANIRTEVLIPACPNIVAAVGDALVLGGILVEEAESVDAAYRERGLVPDGRATMGDWVALCYRRARS